MSPEIVPTPEADIQWRNWRAQGLADDRRRAAVMGRVFGVIVVGFAIWLAVLVF